MPDGSEGGRWLDTHRLDPYAHGPMIGRLQQEYITLRERTENRIGALERFRAQATLLGGIGLIVLGALSAAVFTKFIH